MQRVASTGGGGGAPLGDVSPLDGVSTPRLARALHRRRYKWETLAAAGLDFSNFSAVQLLHWLRKDRRRYREALRASRLGLGVYETEELPY
jgi:hypothetical protein